MILQYGHFIWKETLPEGGRAIDATCGNGHDTFFLSQLHLSHLYVFDIQKEALLATQKRVGQRKNISYHLGCHSRFEGVKPPIDLIVYNLGYLPGGDKSLTTRVETTVLSVEKGLSLLSSRGMLSMTLYPGHQEGKREEEALLALTKSFSPKDFRVSHLRLLNRSHAPSLLLIQKGYISI